ncbi:MAG: Crp/Fnr family transcriptional regulator [Tissierellia bacterium]|nr:Crp/Fnr family transcriptional regulator [Tissierellia bacterium]
MIKSLIFDGFTLEDEQKFLEKGNSFTKEFGDGEVIFHIGDTPTHLYILLDGIVHVENLQPSGRKVLVNRFENPGTVFGEVYLYLKDQPFDYQCVASRYAKVLLIPKEILLDTKDQEEFQEKMKNNMLSILSHKAYYLNRRFLVFAEGSIREKILKDLKQRLEREEVFTFYGTREEWASLLGIPRPSLSRELVKLQEEGILQIKRGKVIVKREDLDRGLDELEA